MDQSFVFLINPNKFQAAFALGLPFVRGFVLRYPPSARGSLRGRLRIGGTSNLDPNRQVMWESSWLLPQLRWNLAQISLQIALTRTFTTVELTSRLHESENSVIQCLIVT